MAANNGDIIVIDPQYTIYSKTTILRSNSAGHPARIQLQPPVDIISYSPPNIYTNTQVNPPSEKYSY